jgi:hypothetical protein
MNRTERLIIALLIQVVVGWGVVMLIGATLPSVLTFTQGLDPMAVGFAVGVTGGLILGLGYGIVISLYIPKAKLPSLHFSLRTLLIATAIVAIVLGLIVWVTRS